MAKELIECIPNISVAHDDSLLIEIIEVLEKVPHLHVLHVDSSKAIKRSVITMVGPWTAVYTAVHHIGRLLVEGADLRDYDSPHPHVGLLDVCPIVPIRGVTEKVCVELVKTLAVSMNNELEVPIYFYEKSATGPDRRRLESIRKGGRRNLEIRSRQDFLPDVGKELHLSAGAIVMGVRDYLIAYNITLKSGGKGIADRIAKTLRKLARDCVLTGVKAIGWYNEDYGAGQISINLTDPVNAGMFDVFDKVSLQASVLGVEVAGSELIGMVPLRHVVASGLEILSREENHQVWNRSNCVEAAISYLGLDQVRPFIPEKQILDLRYQDFSGEEVIF